MCEFKPTSIQTLTKLQNCLEMKKSCSEVKIARVGQIDRRINIELIVQLSLFDPTAGHWTMIASI